jgi:charged multivesicular body protein 1
MDKFEKEFEDLDVQTSVMEGAMSQTTATNIPTDSVDILMKQAADEAGIELSHELPSAASNTIGTAQQVFKSFSKTVYLGQCKLITPSCFCSNTCKNTS